MADCELGGALPLVKSRARWQLTCRLPQRRRRRVVHQLHVLGESISYTGSWGWDRGAEGNALSLKGSPPAERFGCGGVLDAQTVY